MLCGQIYDASTRLYNEKKREELDEEEVGGLVSFGKRVHFRASILNETQLKEHREIAANQTEAARQHEREMAVLAHNHTMQLAFRQEFGTGTLRLHQPDGNVFELVSMCPAPQMTVQTCALETEPALLCPRSTLSPPPTAGRAARLPVTILPRTSSACGSAWSRSPAASV